MAAKYPQYVDDPPNGPVLVVTIKSWTGWQYGDQAGFEETAVTDNDRSTVEVAQIVARTPARLRPSVAWVMGTGSAAACCVSRPTSSRYRCSTVR